MTKFFVTAPAETIWRTPACVGRLNEKRIVVADDDFYAAGAIASALIDTGFSVRTAHTGLHAVNIGARWEPAAVVLDLGMPLGDSWEAARAIRDADATMFIVALTADTTYVQWYRSREGEFDAYLTKPCNIDRLIGIVSRRFPN